MLKQHFPLKHFPFKGGDAYAPIAAPSERPVIVLITFVVSEKEVTARLDTQKEMFIDRVPEIWDADYAREIAREISAIYP